MCAQTVFAPRPAELLTLREAAEYLHRKPSTLYHWRCRKHNPIPCIEIAGRFFYRREDLDAFIKRMNSTISHEKKFKED